MRRRGARVSGLGAGNGTGTVPVGSVPTRPQPPDPSPCRLRSGFTLVEILVAMSVLLLLGLLMVALMRASLDNWTQAERQRKVYSRARAVFDCLQEDFEAALTRDPPGSPAVARMFCEPNAKTGRQVLMLVRSFGSGPERPYAFRAGDGLDAVDFPPGDPAKPRPDDEDANPRSGRADEEHYNNLDDDGDGHVDEDLMPLGGSAQVVYMHEGRQLRRALCAPCLPKFDQVFPYAQTLSDDVLHFEVLFATPYTTTWEELSGPGGKRLPLLPSRKDRLGQLYGPERLWDSTRGVLQGFSFFVNKASLADGDDDVFPDRVRVTLVVEPDPLRTLRTDTLDQIDDGIAVVRVASLRGFPPPGTDRSYILVDDEWMHYKGIDEDRRAFIVDQRGARGTTRASHAEGSPVRCGTTFVRTFFLPGYRKEEAVGVTTR